MHVNSSGWTATTCTGSSSLERSVPGQLESVCEVGLVQVDGSVIRTGLFGFQPIERLCNLVLLVARAPVIVDGYPDAPSFRSWANFCNQGQTHQEATLFPSRGRYERHAGLA